MINEYDYVSMGLMVSLLFNVGLLFIVRTMKGRENLILKTSEEMIAISEAFSSELSAIKTETEEA